MRRVSALLFAALVISFPASAQNFDGRYEGNLLLTRDGGDCGNKAEKFQAEIKGKLIRITSPRMDKPLEGEIAGDGQFLVSSTGRGNTKLEWRAQILSTKSGLGSMLARRGDSVCQFLLSLKQV
jgi:hypothetical protein